HREKYGGKAAGTLCWLAERARRLQADHSYRHAPSAIVGVALCDVPALEAPRAASTQGLADAELSAIVRRRAEICCKARRRSRSAASLRPLARVSSARPSSSICPSSRAIISSRLASTDCARWARS